MKHGYARVILFSFVLLGWLCFCGVSGGAVDAAAGHARSQGQPFAQRRAGYSNRIRPPLRPAAVNQRQFLPRTAPLSQVESLDVGVTGNSEKAVVPRFSHQQGSSVSSSDARAVTSAEPARKKQYLQVFAEKRSEDRQQPGSTAMYVRRPNNYNAPISQVTYENEPDVGYQSKNPAGSERSSENYLGAGAGADAGAGVIPDYPESFAQSQRHDGSDDPGALGHSLIEKAFDDNFFSSESDGSQPTQGQKINPVVAEFYETGVSPNKTRAGSDKKGKNKSPNREDIFDYVETYAVDDPSSSGSGYGSNELDLNPALFLPPLAPAGPKLYPRPAPSQPDYVYKFKFYPAVGYHPNAKIIYLDDHDYYHPYYTPSGYESLKTVKKSVSKIQKELKKATKYQPHYDHLYGKGRVKQYLVSKPPPNWGPPPSYGHGKRPYHQAHPVTAFHGAGHIDEYLSYGENIDFDRDGKDVEDE